MANPVLAQILAPIADTHDRCRLRRLQTRVWLLATLAGGAMILLHNLIGMTYTWELPLLVVLALGIHLLLRRRYRRTDVPRMAREIEADHPELHQLLLTAVDAEPERGTGRYNHLQKRVIREALERNCRRPWNRRDNEHYFFAQALNALCILAFLVVAVVLAGIRPPASATGGEVPDGVRVGPGDAEVERGSSLVVTATFEEDDVPAEATLILLPSEGPARRIPLVRNLEDPVFGTSVLSVDSDTIYSVEYGERNTRDYRLTVFDHPDLVQADATLDYPEYTRLPNREIRDTRRITALEGTRLDYRLLLNKPGITATMTTRNGTLVDLEGDRADPAALRLRMKLEEDETYRLDLKDAEGRRNKAPIDLVVRVRENRHPELKLILPYGDARFSPVEEVDFAGEASDDFGLGAHGLAYTVGSGEPVYLETGSGSEANETASIEHLLELENQEAPPRTLVSFFLWAEDHGPDGEMRRSFSDMYFAEIRPFEEIFREDQSGQQQQQQQQQGGSPMMELAELQKEIVNATWNIQRRENRASPSDMFAEDVGVVLESQRSLIPRLEALGEQMEDERNQDLVRKALAEMETTAEHLDAAIGTESPAGLGPAVASARNAYQYIIRMQPDEYAISRSNQGGGSGGGSRSQQQLDQLEMSNEADRYETQSQAGSTPEEGSGEDLQILNRLKELARRQQDLNQRLQELQTALEEAADQEEREEIEHQLKRLREEQRQMLEDMDETRQRMAGSENSRNAESLSELDRIREETQQAGEALEEGRISQSLASGTRAQQGLEDLRDDFQRENSRRFTREMQELRRQARELAERQDRIRDDLESARENQQRTRSLARSDEVERVMDNTRVQRETLDSILDDVRSISEESEETEPILSRQLHEAYRSTDPEQVGAELENTRQLTELNLLEQAQVFEGSAHRSIDELHDRIDRASESILGDGIESLRQAERTLDELLEDVRREIAGNSPSARQDRQGNGPGDPSVNDSSGNLSPGEEQGGAPGGEQERSSGREGNRTGESGGTRPGEQEGGRGGGDRQGEGVPGEQTPGEEGRGDREGSGRGSGRGDPAEDDQQGRGGDWNLAEARRGGSGGGGGSAGGPLTGDDFTEFSDRLREVEEMIDVPELQNEVSTVRDRSRAVRIDYRRNGKEPQWDLVQMEIETPLAEVLRQVREELARRIDKDAVVPVDRDPVPREYTELVRRYYESLGESRETARP